jgi:hypothetical protein
MKMDELFYECWQHTICLQKIEQKRVEQIYVGLFSKT